MKIKTFIFSLFMLSVSTHSNASVNLLDVSYLSGDENITGYKFGYTGAVENFSFTASSFDTDFGVNLDTFSFSARLGHDNFQKGAAYVGFSHTKDASTDLILGYALISANQLSFNISYTDSDQPVSAASVRIPYDQSNAIQFGVIDSDDQRILSFGYSKSF